MELKPIDALDLENINIEENSYNESATKKMGKF